MRRGRTNVLRSAAAFAVVAALAVPADSGAVVGGRPAGEGEFPWVAAVLGPAGDPSADRAAGCGGTLIEPRVVLTAGHCVTELLGDGLDPERAARVVLGRRDLRSSAGEIHDVVRVVRHPFFDAERLLYDLALLELREPARVDPIDLVPRRTVFREGQAGTTAGWGLTSDRGRPSPRLLAARLPLWSNNRCARAYRHHHVPGLMLCAAGRRAGRDVCDGDSGGPLVVNGTSGEARLLGVVSFGHADGCATGRYPTNFAWVTSPFMRAWIERRAAALQHGLRDEVAPAVASLRRRGRVVRYTLSEPAEVVVAVGRRLRGRTVQLPGALVTAGEAGENAFRLPAATLRRLKGRGRFFLRAVATDRAGNLSRRVTVALQAVGPRP